MAVKTPSNTQIHEWGSNILYIYTFTDIDDGDTFASGIPYGEVHAWFNATDDPTAQGKEGVDVAESSGTFTFSAGEDDRTGDLLVLASDSLQ